MASPASRAGTARREGAHDFFGGAAFACWWRISARCSIPALPARWRLFALLHDAPEYVIGDMISPFKAALGDVYKEVEERLARRSCNASRCRPIRPRRSHA